MMLANRRAACPAGHDPCALADVLARHHPARSELRAIRLADRGLLADGRGSRKPRVAVAGLNPHAGEDGKFGREEIDIIAPAIAAARAEGLDASGPWPGDTVFMRARAAAISTSWWRNTTTRD